MANFLTASWATQQAKLIKSFQSSELRFRIPAVHNLFLENTEIMIPDYMELLKANTVPLETNYVTRTPRSLVNSISHNHTGAQGDSAILTPTWTPYSDTFVSTLKESNSKIYSLEEMHMSKISNEIANFAEGLDTVAANYLFANRSGVNIATAEGTFDATDDVFLITEATNGNRSTQITKMIMDINKYKGNYDVVCDSISFNLFDFQLNQGEGNAENTSFQFDGVRFIHDPSLTAAAAGLVGAYSKGFWIVVPIGTIAALPWIPVQNRGAGFSSKENDYSNINNPIDGINYGLHTYQERVDGTALGGNVQDLKIETQIFTYLSYAHAPLSNAGETPLMAFALV